MTNIAPSCLTAMTYHAHNIDPAEYGQRLLSSSDRTRLFVSRSFERTGDTSFTIATACLLNEVPVSLRESNLSLSMFKQQLKLIVSIKFVLFPPSFSFIYCTRSVLRGFVIAILIIIPPCEGNGKTT